MSGTSSSRGLLTALADGCEHAGFTLVLTAEAILRGFVPRRPLRAFARLVEQFHVQMVKSLLVVTVVGLFTGMVLALQTGEELRRYGAESQLGAIVGATMAREMGPFITAIILAATVGAGIAAEIGTMRVSEELDALEMMNVEPVTFLVTPRVQALGVAAVLLTALVDTVGTLGGAVVANAQLGTPYADFLEGARNVLASEQVLGLLSKDAYSGFAKAFVFGILIAGVSSAAGLRASGGALGVGRAVRSSVVASVVLTLIVGYVMTWVFWA